MVRLMHLSLLLLSCAAIGCGPNLGAVTGNVTIDGQPAEKVVVAFSPVGGGTSGAGTTDASGNYTIMSSLGAGLPPGKYKVSLTTEMTVEDTGGEDEYAGGSDSAAYEQAAMGNDYADRDKFKEKIPAKYNSATTLEEQVEAGENVIDFKIEK